MSSVLDSQSDSYTQWAARGLLVAGLWAGVWLIGGYYPFSKFTCLSFLGAATILLWLEPLKLSSRLGVNKLWLVVAVSFIGIGILQSLPLGEKVPDGLTGVQGIRLAFGDQQSLFPFSLSPWQTRSRLATMSIGIVGFFVSMMLFHTKRSRIFVLASIALCGILQVFWGIVQAARFPNFIFWNVENPGGSRPFGTFLNCNHGADFVGMSFACALGIAWWWYRDDSGSNSFEYGTRGVIQSISASPLLTLVWLSMAWLLLGLALTVSRGGWISFLLAFIALPVLWRRLSKERRVVLPLIVLACFSLAGIGIQALGLGDRIERRLDDLEVERVLADSRFEHWKEVVPAVRHFVPFGSGLGTYGYAYLPFHPKPANSWFTYAHNQYLETVVELGLAGCVLLLIAMSLAFRTCLQLCGSDRPAIHQGVGVAAMAAFLMQALHAFTDFGLMMPANLLTLGVILGVAVNAANETTLGRPGETKSRFALATQRRSAFFGMVTLTAILGAALWHQMAEVRSERLLTLTEFDPATPAPNLPETENWIGSLEAELQKSPENEHLLRRLIQLRIHHAHRASFEKAVQAGVAYSAAWDSVSVEAAIARLFDDSENAMAAEEKQEIRQLAATNQQLNAAWENLEASQALNPLQPRTQFRMAELAAVTGRDWEAAFARSNQLSVVDPSLSLSNGLLAWAVNDTAAMIGQWRQTLETYPASSMIIFSLARKKLSDEDFVERLMPDRWTVPYRLALQLKAKETATLRMELLRKADSIAQATIREEPARSKARATIALTSGDRKLALQLLADVAKANPDDPEARYRYALVLLEDGQVQEAVLEARVAVHLEPGKTQYSRLFERARKRQQGQ